MNAATKAVRAEERAADRSNRPIVTALDEMWIKAYEAEAKAARSIVNDHETRYSWTLEAIADAKQATEEAKKAQEDVERIGLENWINTKKEKETASEAQRAQNDAAKAARKVELQAEMAAEKVAAEKRTAERAAAVAAENSAVAAQQAAAQQAWANKEAAQKAKEKAAAWAAIDAGMKVDHDAWASSQLQYREDPKASDYELINAEAKMKQYDDKAVENFRVGFRLTDKTKWLDYLVRSERNKTSSTGSTSSTENTGTGPTGTGGRRKNKKVFSRKRKNISYSVGRNTRKKSIKRGGMSSAYFAAMEEMRSAGLLEDTQKAIAQAQADREAGIGPYKRPDTKKTEIDKVETDKTEIDKVETNKPEVRKRWWRLSQII